MVRQLLSTAAVAVLAGGILCASQTGDSGTGNKIAATGGREMFGHYCTPCHGADGRGTGPVVVEHKAPPVDLTVLSKKNHGAFPEAHVIRVLQHGAGIPTHSAVEMPVWGPVLGKINQSDPRDRMVRVQSLTAYLESIQVK